MPTTLNKPTHILILTPISVEYNEVRPHFDVFTEEIINDVCYGFGHFKGKFQDLSIVLCQTGSKNRVIALATERAIQLFKPSVVLLVGIAGGVKDVVIGDVVIGTKAYGYESGKETEDGPVSRPDVVNYSQKLLAIAESIGRKADWKARNSNHSASSTVFFGPIASGNKVIASTKTTVYAFLKKHYNDTLALEMEAIGFGQTMLHYPHIQALNIRGISDLLDNKSTADTGGSQGLAASRAAAFTFELIYNLDISQFKVSTMDIKTMAKEVFEMVLPILKMEATQKISSDIKEATNTSIDEVWAKIKPLFIEEFGDMKEIMEDEDAPAVARRTLQKAMQKDDNLKVYLEALLKKVKPNLEIKKSKNIIQGSTISVGGDFSLGDG